MLDPDNQNLAEPAAHGNSLSQVMRSFSENFVLFIQGVKSALQALGDVAIKVGIAFRSRKNFRDSGWLPHRTTPVDIASTFEGSATQLATEIEMFYRANWGEVSQDLSAHLEAYQLNDESKAVFLEAIKAHEAGFYRAVCRLLLVEIERVVRVEFNEGRHGNINDLDPIRYMSRELGSVPADCAPTVSNLDMFRVDLFRIIKEHVYESVKSDERQTHVQSDPIPNRHASLHGLATYNTFQNSLNSIFLADYVFESVSNLKVRRMSSGVDAENTHTLEEFSEILKRFGI